jgi:hypothetical protein
MDLLQDFRDTLIDLAKRRRTAKIRYQKPDGGAATIRIVEPYSLEDHLGDLLVVCWQLDPPTNDGTCWRSFRIDRMQEVTDSQIPFVPRVPVLIDNGGIMRFHPEAGAMLEMYAEAVHQFQPPVADTCTLCGRPILKAETPSVIEHAIVCRECHDRVRPICPYCQVVLRTLPRSKRPCPECGGIIYVRAAQTFFSSIYLTDVQVKEIEPFGQYASAVARRVRDQTRLSLGREPLTEEVKRGEYYEACRNQPASYAQLCYAFDLGLVPPGLSAFDVGRLLTAFKELSWHVESEGAGTVDEQKMSQKDIGAIIKDLISDPEFRRLAGRDIEWVDVKLTEAARKYLRRFLRLRRQ